MLIDNKDLELYKKKANLWDKCGEDLGIVTPNTRLIQIRISIDLKELSEENIQKWRKAFIWAFDRKISEFKEDLIESKR